MDRKLHEDGGFMDGCMSEKQTRWLLENKRLKSVYLLSGLQQVSVAYSLPWWHFGGLGFNYFLITYVCGMCSVEQLPSSMLGRWLPWGFSSQASEAQCKAYFSLGNIGHLTTEVTNSVQVKNQCITFIFSALLYIAAANRQRHFRFFLKLFILILYLPPVPTLHYY